MNGKHLRATAIGIGVALTLTACAGTAEDGSGDDAPAPVTPTSTTEALPTPETSATPSSEPSAEAAPLEVEDIDVASLNGWGYDASQVVIPKEVREVFGDRADSVVNDALMVTHIGYVEQPDFLQPGWTDEEYDLAWASFSENFLAPNLRSEMEERDSRRNLMLAIPQDGVVGTLDGVEYTIPADTVGLDYQLATNPVVALADSGDAVYVGFDLMGEFNSEPAHSTHDLYIHYNLIPAGEDAMTDWVIDGYTIETANTTVTDP